jgi:hypothetical protein
LPLRGSNWKFLSWPKELKTEKTKSSVKNTEIVFIVVEIGFPKVGSLKPIKKEPFIKR